MSNNATASQKRRWQQIVALGCLCCGGPANIHHCLHECGMGQENHDHVAPLCQWCHQDGPVSRHGTPGEFAMEWGTDKDLHERAVRMLDNIMTLENRFGGGIKNEQQRNSGTTPQV